MATTTPTATSAFTFPRSLSPTKDALKPNAHPYPIKTTSTGLLSRSNSSPQHQSHHSKSPYYYIPSSSPTPSRAQPSPSPTRDEHGHGHRYSKSLTSDFPMPLPIPPSFPSPSPSPTRQFNTPPPHRRFKRAETLPTPPPSTTHPTPLEDLPPNPKSWTPAQLSAYLATALRVKSGDALQLPLPVTRDITAFVRERQITGKSFLRFSEGDLEEYGINKLWCTTLLAASRNLRQNVLHGRIWDLGPTNDSCTESHPQVLFMSDDEGTPNGKHARGRSNTNPNTNPFSDGLYSSGSSSSSLNLSDADTPLNQGQAAVGGRYRSGKVKGMVETFERSTSANGRGRRQRSGSASSVDDDSGRAEDIFGETAEGTSKLDIYAIERPLARFPSSEPELRTYATSRPQPFPPSQHQYQPQFERELEQQLHVADPDLTSESDSQIFETASEAESEPTIEDLLAASPGVGASAWEMDSGIGETVKHISESGSGGSGGRKGGVHAWETEDGAGVTVKHISSAPGVDSGGSDTLGTEFDDDVAGAASWMEGGSIGRASGRGSKGRAGRRAVADIFEAVGEGDDEAMDTDAISVVVAEDAATGEKVLAVLDIGTGDPDASNLDPDGRKEENTDVPSVTADDVEAPTLDLASAADIEARENEMNETRALIEAFKLRLEEVEKKVGDMEEMERERESARLEAAARETERLEREQEEEGRREVEAVRRRQAEDAQVRSKERALRLREEESKRRSNWVGLGVGGVPLSMLLSPRIVLERVLGYVGMTGASEPVPTSSTSTSNAKSSSGPSVLTPSATAVEKKREGDTISLDPQSVRALPSYVLLVSLGVCVVVLRVVLRRVVAGATTKRR